MPVAAQRPQSQVFAPTPQNNPDRAGSRRKKQQQQQQQQQQQGQAVNPRTPPTSRSASPVPTASASTASRRKQLKAAGGNGNGNGNVPPSPTPSSSQTIQQTPTSTPPSPSLSRKSSTQSINSNNHGNGDTKTTTKRHVASEELDNKVRTNFNDPSLLEPLPFGVPGIKGAPVLPSPSSAPSALQTMRPTTTNAANPARMTSSPPLSNKPLTARGYYDNNNYASSTTAALSAPSSTATSGPAKLANDAEQKWDGLSPTGKIIVGGSVGGAATAAGAWWCVGNYKWRKNRAAKKEANRNLALQAERASRHNPMPDNITVPVTARQGRSGIQGGYGPNSLMQYEQQWDAKHGGRKNKRNRGNYRDGGGGGGGGGGPNYIETGGGGGGGGGGDSGCCDTCGCTDCMSEACFHTPEMCCQALGSLECNDVPCCC